MTYRNRKQASSFHDDELSLSRYQPEQYREPDPEPMVPLWLEPFCKHLLQKGFSTSTVLSKAANMGRFLRWAEENNYTGIELMSYQDLMAYVEFLRSKGSATTTITIRLNCLRQYYEFLKQEGVIYKNPAWNLKMKEGAEKIVIDPLTPQELEKLYIDYARPKDSYAQPHFRQEHLKRLVILGFMIYQGMHSGEIGNIRNDHIDLNDGTITIPQKSKKQGKKRVLRLDNKQLLVLQKYLTTRKLNGPYLIEDIITNVINYLLSELRKINPVIQNLQHIRASVIINWLKSHDKRYVQYMIGHRNIMSIEKYEDQKMEGLIDLVEKYHPFG